MLAAHRPLWQPKLSPGIAAFAFWGSKIIPGCAPLTYRSNCRLCPVVVWIECLCLSHPNFRKCISFSIQHFSANVYSVYILIYVPKVQCSILGKTQYRSGLYLNLSRTGKPSESRGEVLKSVPCSRKGSEPVTVLTLTAVANCTQSICFVLFFINHCDYLVIEKPQYFKQFII